MNDFLSQEEIDMLLKGTDLPADADDGTTEEEQAAVPDQADRKGLGRIELERLLDFPLTLSVRLGEAKKTLAELSSLNFGTVVELSHKLSEPVDVLINGKVVARGEVIVVEENFGIQITEIIAPRQRLEGLRR
ncbi:MAG: flagellar motor switch protein FliN [Dethiobacteria bacterium]|jgi:flagellar motor switch protein FliN/FliY|nr:flagellar motor switch protein FliN [Bacillota bacterium]